MDHTVFWLYYVSLMTILIQSLLIAYPHYLLLSPLLSFLILIAYPHNLLFSPAPSILLNTYRIPSLPSLVPPLLSFLMIIEYPYYLLLSPPILPPLQNTINFENTIPPHFCISCSKQMLYSVLN